MKGKRTSLEVTLTGEDGNIFNLIGIVSKEMKRNGYRELVKEFQDDITSSKSYEEALQKIATWADIR